ncbi:tRNA (adenosine(37)-N6)-dimethylallyltransferase MiaA [Gammaproteobacteria bacterium]|nr:tRNA (adenosine(37)-N6)-dimethylallyltransferase MiaA [Gammaproteobacteria bacterium]
MFLLGPTASGKTEVAINLFKKFNIELISVDSVMVYKGANIGSAKPTHDILSEYPHHLVNNKSLNEIYSVAEFCSDSKKIIQEVHSRNKIPLFVGGSMMYFKSLLKGIDNLPERDDSYRKILAEMKISESDHFLYDLLVSKDPDYAKVIKPNDEKRTIRALEVINKTGKKMSEQINPNLNSLFFNTYDIHQMAIYDKDREKLHKRIEHRLLTMFKEGLIDEVHELINQYSIKEQHPILSAVNYKQTIDYLEGRINKEELFNQALYASRQLAKRQITWIRSWDDLNVFNINSQNEIEKSIKFFI